MTYDTSPANSIGPVTTLGNTRNGTNEVRSIDTSMPPPTTPQKHSHTSNSVDIKATDIDDMEQEGSCSSQTSPMPTISPQHSDSSSMSYSNSAELEKESQELPNENNNTIPTADCKVQMSEDYQESAELTSSSSAGTSDIRKSTDDQPAICYNPVLDDEIRTRLDKLNALSDLINSLEVQFDHANLLFRETLNRSTERLSIIAKTLGSKSIQHGRIYHEAKLSVEQTQADCQRACVQFERANNDHQFAKLAIKEAELKLKQMNMDIRVNSLKQFSNNSSFEFSDFGKLSLNNDDQEVHFVNGTTKYSENICDNKTSQLDRANDGEDRNQKSVLSSATSPSNEETFAQITHESGSDVASSEDTRVTDAAKLSEDLNQAINRLIDAERKRQQSEKLHLDQANKLMIAQENLLKLEREYGSSIKRSQIYFYESRQFNIRLNSVKRDIAKISEEIIQAKQAYAKALNDLEQFSEELHLSSKNTSSLENKPRMSQQSMQALDDTMASSGTNSDRSNLPGI